MKGVGTSDIKKNKKRPFSVKRGEIQAVGIYRKCPLESYFGGRVNGLDLG